MLERLKSVPCVDCSHAYPFYVMDFDHVRGEKLGQVPKMGSFKAIRQEASKCDVVCANCHRLRSQMAGKGHQRVTLDAADMMWLHRSSSNPQTRVRMSAPRPWHPAAGALPDGMLASTFGVTRGAVRKYHKRMGIPPFTRQGRVPTSKELTCVD